MDLSNLDKGRKRRSSVNLGTLVYGKVPPQAKELEEAVLGAIMLEKDAFDKVNEILKAENFYVDAHQRIFTEMSKLSQRNQPIDILTVVEALLASDQLEKVGGAEFVTRLTNSVVSSAHIEEHSRIIFQKFISREALRISGEVLGLAYEHSTDPLDLVDKLQSDVDTLQDMIARNRPKQIFRDLVYDRVTEIIQNDGKRPPGVLTGLKELDNILLALFPGNLYVVGARPGMGKTALMVQLAKNIGGGIPNYSLPEAVGAISMETSARDYADRHIANHSRIDSRILKQGGLEEHEKHKVHSILMTTYEEKIYTDFTPGLKMSDIRRIAKKWVRDHRIKSLLVDYAQIVEAEEKDQWKTEEQQIGIVLLALLNLSKELGISVVAFAQMNRENMKTNDKRPEMHHFRGSGKIEAIARAAIAIHRDEYYEIYFDDQERDTRGIAELIVLKNNDGRKGNARVAFDAMHSIFRDIETHSPTESSSAPQMFIALSNWKPMEEPLDDDTPF